MKRVQEFALLYRVWVIQTPSLPQKDQGYLREVELPRLRTRLEVEGLLARGYAVRTKLADVEVRA